MSYPAHTTSPPLATRGRRLAFLFVLCVCLSALAPSAAFGLSQRGHVFSFSYGVKGKGEGEFSDPSALAVSDATGDVYVADRKNKRVVQLAPVSEDGTLTALKWVRTFTVPSPTQVAVDNSGETGDPSQGDVYVLGANGKAIFKFTPEGAPLGKPIKYFQPGEGEKVKLEALQGIATDTTGTLYVWAQDGELYVYSAEQANKSLYSLATGLQGAPGLALDSHGDLYAGVEGAAGLTGVAKLEGITGTLLCPDVTGEGAATALAVNPLDTPAAQVDEQDDLYTATLTETAGEEASTITQYAPVGECGQPLQTLSHPGLKDASGLAVDGHTGAVYVSDAASDQLDVFDLEPAAAPTVESLTAGAATPPAAGARVLSARIDARGSQGTYSFQYGTAPCASAGACTESPPVQLAASFGEQQATLQLAGLAPGLYHYRLTISYTLPGGASGTVQSPERTVAILAAPSGLPDGRAWEMVTPPDKHGSPIEPLGGKAGAGGLILASETGEALTYFADGPVTETAESNRSPEVTQLLATRTSEGWVSQNIATPQSRAQGSSTEAHITEYPFFSPDLALALVEPYDTSLDSEPPLAPGATQTTGYLRADPPLTPEAAERSVYEQAVANDGFLAPGYLPLVSEADVAPSSEFGAQVHLAGSSPDLTHVLLASSVPLLGAGSAPGLYEFSEGSLRLVSLLPGEEGGGPAPEAALGYPHLTAHAISEDGSRVIWTASDADPAQLYLTDTATSPVKSVRLDRAVEGLPQPGVASAVFQTASSDASRVLFTDDQVLTKDSSASPASGHEQSDLYDCEITETAGQPACALRDLTVPVNAGEHAGVQGYLLGASEDASSVYLVAHGVLATNENGDGQSATPGGENVYELHAEGSGWTSTFIATLSAQDGPDWGEVEALGDTSDRTARVSPDGRYLAFMSQQPLTGYDNEDATSDQPGERPDEEVFLYDSATAALTCVSCDPTGARPTGVFDQEYAGEGGIGLLADRDNIWRGRWLAGSIPGWTGFPWWSSHLAATQSRYLTDQGRLFFDAADPLTPAITVPTRPEQVQGKTLQVGVENVYEYEPAATGSCTATSGGCVGLLSSGTSEHESAFLEATPDGGSVFLLTAAALSPQDTDTAFDIYDARECTSGSPCLPPPAPAPAPCASADTCHPAADTEQPSGTPASVTFTGPGNLAQPPHAGGEVKGDTSKAKPPSAAQKLQRALAACKKQYPHSKRKRQSCEAHARETYAPRKASRK